MQIRPETKEVIRSLLEFLAVGATFPIAVLAPNTIGPITKFLSSRRIDPRKARAVIHYLKRHNLVIVRSDGDADIVAITKKGRRVLRRYELERLSIPKPRRWDGRWRLVAFDVPEDKRPAREALRRKLQELDFIPLQRSVWAHPYPCQDEINFVAEIFHVSPYLWLFEAVKIDHESYLKRRFGL